MRAEINTKGLLNVIPETELEAYALRCWVVNNPAILNAQLNNDIVILWNIPVKRNIKMEDK